MTRSKLDPRTASVTFAYANRGSAEHPCYGRSYYWYDPDGEEPSIDDWVFRDEHPEIDDDEWLRLFAAAFDRGERSLLLEMKQERPEMFESDDGLRSAMLGYIFGPARPSRETLELLGLIEPDSDEPAPATRSGG